MTPEEIWNRYSAIWSAPTETRRVELQRCLAEACSYCDVNGLLKGREALSDYMAGFQASFPGGTFRILGVIYHHDRSLASWECHCPDGSVLMTGRSYASTAADGRLENITGFFDPPRPAQHL